MRLLSRGFAVVAAVLALSGCSDGGTGSAGVDQTRTAAGPAAGRAEAAAGFDFYVLALSWSPSYCEAEGSRADRRQCGRNGPAGFVVHGLWPQKAKGYPANCRSAEPDRVPRQLLSSVRDVFPSDGLAAYQWRKHGTCSGLSQRGYFDLTREARDRVRIPPGLGGGSVSPKEVENAFIRSNRGLDGNEIAVACDGRLLREVRICLDGSLDFTACPAVDAAGCHGARLSMPDKR